MQLRALVVVGLAVGCGCRAGSSATSPAENGQSKASRWASDFKLLESARRSGDLRTTVNMLSDMRELAPNNPQLSLALARIAAARHDTDEGVRWLAQYVAAGMTLGAEGDKLLAALATHPRTGQLTEQLAANARPVGAARMAFALPAGDKLFEDIAWDPQEHRFYLSSVRDRRVYTVNADGKGLRPLTAPEPDGMGVVGVAFDPVRRALWMSSAPLPPVPGYHKGDDAARASSVASIDISTGQVLQRFELRPDGKPHALTDIAITASGDVLVSDTTAGGVYIVRSGSAVVDQRSPGAGSGGPDGVAATGVLPGGINRLSTDFDSPQTPAPRDDATAYVPDYVLGIARIDTRTGAVSWLSASPEFALSGIDGLYLIKDALIAIQNGTRPPRVVRLALSADGRSVVGATVLAASPELGEPTHGAIVDDQLWFLARSGWARFSDDGTLVSDPPEDAPAIWRVPTARR